MTLGILLAAPWLAHAQDTPGASPACGASSATGGDTGAPCFTNVDDILGGERSSAGASAQVLAAAAPKPAAAPEAPELRIKKVRVSPRRRLRGRVSTVQATLRANQARDDVMVRFFDGDPADDGKLFDVDIVPHITADQPFVVAVPYQPSGCGGRKLFVEAIPLNDPVAPAVASSRTRLRGHARCR